MAIGKKSLVNDKSATKKAAVRKNAAPHSNEPMKAGAEVKSPRLVAGAVRRATLPHGNLGQ